MSLSIEFSNELTFHKVFTVMNRVQILVVCAAICVAFVAASPKFGERIQSDNNTKESDEKLLQVFRPNGATPAPNAGLNSNQLSASDSKQKPILEKKQKKVNDTKIVTNNSFDKEVSNERHIEYKFSAIHEKIDDNTEDDNNSTDTELPSGQPAVQHRSGQVDSQEPHATPPQPQPRHRFEIPPPPDFSEFQFEFPADIMQLASEHISGPPVPPPPPKAPPQHSPLSSFNRFHPRRSHQEHNYEQSPNQQSFYESAPSHAIDPDFSFDIPQGLPHPNKDPRVAFKKEQMGAQNTRGKPFGTKMSYTYRDPKNPNNFMEMSEVRMTVNREMDPQEAQSQIQEFIAAAQSGRYGPLATVGETDRTDERHERPHHNYDTESSNFASDPKEPAEPNFPNF